MTRRTSNPALRRRGPTAGFTLIELALVISILIALSAVLVPSVGQLIGRQDMADVEEELLDAVDLAHSMAIASGAAYTVSVEPANADLNGVVVVREGEPGQSCAQVQTGGAIVRRVQLAPADAQVDTSATPGVVAPRVLRTTVQIEPPTVVNDGDGVTMCFKGDGSMRDPALNIPFVHPDNTAPSAGDVVIPFRQHNGGSATGVQNYIVVSYNGTARARF